MGVMVGADPLVEARADGLLRNAALAEMLGDGQVLVGKGLATQHEIEAGMELAVIGQDIDGSIASELYEVAAVIDSPVEIVNRAGIVAALSDVQVLLQMGDEAHEIVVHLRESEQVGQVIKGFGTLPVLTGTEVKPWYEVVPQLVGMIEVILSDFARLETETPADEAAAATERPGARSPPAAGTGHPRQPCGGK